MNFVTKVKALTSIFFGAIGWVIGGSIGIAAMGTAIAGGWVLALIVGVLAWFISPSVIDVIARRFKTKLKDAK